MGIEPTTLSLKGRVGLLHRAAGVRKLLANTGQVAGNDSTRHQILAPFHLSFGDRLLTVRELAAFLAVSTRAVYSLCDEGRLAHVRVANAIRVEPDALVALIRSRTE
ncbi:MAG TPA: helix-turn-helix domain-containing protein [Myxococcales bacterium]